MSGGLAVERWDVRTKDGEREDDGSAVCLAGVWFGVVPLLEGCLLPPTLSRCSLAAPHLAPLRLALFRQNQQQRGRDRQGYKGAL